jgi:hypothetical protein
MKYKKKMTKITGLVTGARTTELGILWWLAEWLGVGRCIVNSQYVL